MNETMLDRLETAVANDWGHLVFHGEGEPVHLHARDLFAMGQLRAGRLRAEGIGAGDRVGIVGPNAPDWIAWAYAVMMLGGTYVPLSIPLRVRDRAALAAQIEAMARGFECARVAAHERYAPTVPPDLLIEWGDVGDTAVEPPEFTRAQWDDSVCIIPTSGSTAAPKGVSRRYGATSAAVMREMLNPDGLAEVPYLSYAPMAHSAGVLGVTAPFESWLTMHLLSPERFARDPAALFRLVGPHRIMIIPAASSAISAALRAIERNPDGVDLSSITRLTFSFDMVDPDVVERLLDVGGKFGLRPEALAAQYGMTEGGATKTPEGAGIRIDEVDLDALVADGVATSAAPGRPSKRIASSGAAYANAMRIAGPDGHELPERHVGEVQFRGNHMMKGYVGPGAHNPFTTDGWFHTGDVGYLVDGEVFITGRSKEVLVQQGKKYHPEDIERAVARELHLAPGACVAFDHAGDIVVLIEHDASDLSEERARATVMNAVGAVVRTVGFVAADSLPKTANGKPQRLAARDQFASGVIREL